MVSIPCAVGSEGRESTISNERKEKVEEREGKDATSPSSVVVSSYGRAKQNRVRELLHHIVEVS